ncbi:MAG: GNAT family N-acetyltransferase [Acidobacteria bacterium]|nr:GNAT family N-acetyltransferase [Acidobacteriota bacterium]
MRLYPEGCRCIEDGGMVVATATLIPFGEQLAWIGMVLTHPEYRRRGLARLLVEDAIADAECLGIQTIKLDATSEGLPLYESLGFEVEQAVERWGREQVIVHEESVPQSSHNTSIPENLLAQDVEAFGAVRSDLLESLRLSGRSSIMADGYVLSREGTAAEYLGPCVASSENAARELIGGHLKTSMGSWYWDLLPANAGAVRCAEDSGFRRLRSLSRMRRGREIATRDDMVYAIAGFEFG